VRQATDALKGNIKHYVFISTLSVFPDTIRPGADETAPVATIADPTTEEMGKSGENYGALKALCEQAAEKAMPGRVSNIRPGLIVGPGDPTGRYTYWPVRIDRGGEVLAPGKPSDPLQYIDARDLAEWTVAVVENGHMGVFNAVGPGRKHTIGELLDACREVSGKKATFTWVNAEFLASHKVSPWSDMPVWIPPDGEGAGVSAVNNEKAISKGLAFRPAAVTAKDTLEWWKKEPEGRTKRLTGLSPEREAAVLAAWRERASKASSSSKPSR
jgi:nucleoside-diphosphate-sugar epimerase